MPRHHDFNPNGPKPPVIPRLAKRWDFSGIWSNTAHLRFFSWYTRMRWWEWPDGSSADWAILGGDFLGDIQGQSQVLAEQRRVRRKMRADAQSLCNGLADGETMTFEDRGYALVRSDVPSTNVALSLGRFSLYWEATGSIGPKRRTATGWKAPYRCRIKWTLYDYYDFAWWVIVGSVPEVLDMGHPFHMTANWKDTTSGVVRCPGATHVTPTGGSGTSTVVQYKISGSVSVDNDCDGKRDTIPEAVTIKTRLNAEDGRGIDAALSVSLNPDPAQPDSPRKIGTYSIAVNWDPALGPPKDWNTPVAEKVDGGAVCGIIPCEGGSCLNMVTRARTQPFQSPETHYDLRVFCACIG